MSFSEADTVRLSHGPLDDVLNDALNYAPQQPDHGWGRLLRRVAGVSEDSMDWVPEERARYARTGAIIVNTGLLAVFSMTLAITTATGTFWLLVIPFALFWGFVIVCLDGWLVAGTHGHLGANRLLVLAPRLLLSVLIGCAISEPIVLWVFASPIDTEVRRGRIETVNTYETTLRECNPANGDEVKRDKCGGHRVNVAGAPAAVRAEFDRTIKARNEKSAAVREAQKRSEAAERFANDECTGVKRRGTSGVPGVAGECERDRAFSDREKGVLGILQDDLAAIEGDVRTKNRELAAAQANYERDVAAEIDRKVEEKRASYGRIGLLDQFEALARLSDRSFHVSAGAWLLRGLLIVIDAMPVLTKLLNGTTTYDRMVAAEVAVKRRLHGESLGLTERRYIAAVELRRLDVESTRRLREDWIHESDRSARARREADLGREIDELAVKLLRRPGGGI